jgi:hypothetical protein
MDEVQPPSERTCQRCGRVDVWDEAAGKWVAAVRDGEVRKGTPHCVHDWDVDGYDDPLRRSGLR